MLPVGIYIGYIQMVYKSSYLHRSADSRGFVGMPTESRRMSRSDTVSFWVPACFSAGWQFSDVVCRGWFVDGYELSMGESV